MKSALWKRTRGSKRIEGMTWRRSLLAAALSASGTVVAALPLPIPVAAVIVAPATTATVYPTSPAGSLAGEFDVTAAGTATYRIPLALAPGRQDIEPKLTLIYRGGGGNGHLGVGWSLEGLSQISRCGANPARDGERRTIGWNDGDNLCIDGNKLNLISGSAQVDGAVYATDQESFRKIVGVGTPHHGFRVYLPNGRIATYGSTPECGSPCTALQTIHAPPNNLTIAYRTWNLASVNDRYGNWMRIEWGKRFPSSDPAVADSSSANTYSAEDYPLAIRYTGHDGTPALTPQRTVTFTYTDRSDDEAGYRRGVHSMLTKRLSKITSSVAGAGTYREYRLAYHYSLASNRSLLHSVTECAGDGVCHPPTSFAWQEASRVIGDSLRETTPIVVGDGQSLQSRRKLGAGLLMLDVNGDGRDDLVYVKGNTASTRTWRLALAYPANGATLNGGAPNLPSCAITTGTYRCEIDTGIVAPDEVSVQVLDYNGDGRRDLLVVDNRTNQPMTTWKILQANGNGFSVVDTFITDHPFTDGVTYDRGKRVQVADVDGDGRPDLLLCEPRLTAGVGQPWHLRKHTGSRWNSTDTLLPFFTNASQDCRDNPVLLLDVDGDGATDMLSGGYNKLYFAMSFVGPTITQAPTALRTIINGFWQGNGQTFYTGGRTADVNGDGLVDVIADRDLPQSAGTLDVFLNTGAGFVPSTSGGDDGYFGLPDQGTEPTLGQAARLDYNGDGRDDLLISNACPSGSVAATCANPRWMVLRATANAPQLGDASDNIFTRRELAGCTGTSSSGCVTHQKGPNATTSWFGYQQTRIGDVDGDELPDMVMVENDKVVVRRNQGAPATDHITEIRDGMAWSDVPSIRIAYAPTTDGSVLSMPLSACAYPVSCTRPSGYLVASHFRDNGVSSALQEFRHSYSDPRRDVLGGGFLGYRTHRVTQVATGATTTVTFNAADAYDRSNGRWWYPLTRLPQRSESIVPLGDGRYRSLTTDYTYSTYLFNGVSTRFVRRTQHNETVREGTSPQPVSNPVLTQTTTHTVYNSYGDPTSTTVNTGVSTLRTAQSYLNDQTNWILGRPTSTTVTSTVGSEVQTRKTVRRYDTATGSVVGIDVEQPAQSTSSVSYDTFGHVVSITETDVSGGVSRTTSSGYDGDEEYLFLSRTTNALGHTSRYNFHRLQGKVAKVTSPNGVTTALEYDGFGRPQHHVRHGGIDALMLYERIDDGNGRSHIETSTQFEEGTTLNTVHDRRGRPLRSERVTSDGTVAYVEQTYDSLGRLSSRSIPFRAGDPTDRESWSYDGLDRVLLHKHADGALSRMQYEGMSLRHTDPLGHVTTTVLDAENQPVTVTDAAGTVTRYSFGPFGSPRSVSDPLGNTTKLATDPRGHVLSLDDPDTGHHEFGYDGFGRRNYEKDAAGREVGYDYDLLDRMIARDDVDGTTRYTYDTGTGGIGALARAVSPNGYAETYGYDLDSRLASIVTTAGSDTVTQKFGYSLTGRLSTALLIAPDGGEFKLAYDYAADGSFARVAETHTDTPLYQVMARNARGVVTTETFRGGTTTSYEINPRNGRTTSITTTNPAQEKPLQALSYRYDFNGNVIERTDAIKGVTEKLGYDKLDRLEKSSVCKTACVDRTLKYDTIGNVLAKWDIGEYTYDSSRPHAVIKAGATTYAYDAVGNQIARNGELRKFNALNKLASVANSGGTPTTFDYDAFGRRLRSSSGSASSLHIGDVFERSQKAGELTDRYSVKVGARSVALLTRSKGSVDAQFIHNDALGSADVVSNKEGKVVADPTFDVFGQSVLGDWGGPPVSLTDSIENDGYTGHRHDAALGLIDMGGRHYDPALARFLQADRFVQAPLRSQSYNRYSYVFNNPLRYVDPSGYEAEDPSYDIEMDPAYIYAGENSDSIEMDTAYVYGDVGSGGAGESEGEGDYDDMDDGDRDDDYDGPGGGDDTGFDDRTDPAPDIDGIAQKAEDLADQVDNASKTLRREAEGEHVDDDDSLTAKKVLVVVVAVAGAAGVAVMVANALTAGGGSAAAADALAGGAAAIAGPPNAPTGPGTLPADATAPPAPETPRPPATFQPAHGINFAEDQFGQMLEHVPPEPGHIDVIIHGDANGFGLPGGIPVTPEQLAEMLMKDFRYNGEAIRLFSCNAGTNVNGAAQQLANALGVDVKATNVVLQIQEGMVSAVDDVFANTPAKFDWIPFSAQ